MLEKEEEKAQSSCIITPKNRAVSAVFSTPLKKAKQSVDDDNMRCVGLRSLRKNDFAEALYLPESLNAAYNGKLS